MQQQIVVDVRNFVPRLPEVRFSRPVNWRIHKDEQWAVIGPNGGGKSLLTDFLQRKYAAQEGGVFAEGNENLSEIIKCITFKDIYSITDAQTSYYQQRWHSTEVDDVPVVSDLLLKGDPVRRERLVEFFNVSSFLQKRVVFLSSGELRKFLIIRALLSNPRILIMDNPFIGLDATSRKLLTDMLDEMAQLEGLQVILLLSNPNDVPEFITHILPVKDKCCLSPIEREAFFLDEKGVRDLFSLAEGEDCDSVLAFPDTSDNQKSYHDITFRMENVTIKYGKKIILDKINWEVKNGDKWALFGPNGSGKSTLLSLIYADNPQSYANTLYLFDRKRGSGESIWEIKKRIGYVSPEMHLYYQENVPAIQIVASGFFDSIGLYRKCNEVQTQKAYEWMKVFGVEHLKDRLFFTLSSGEQRLILLVRAFVKNPDLLIMDEPLHGLDFVNKKKVLRIIEQYCDSPLKTMVYVTHYPQELPPCVASLMQLS